MTDKLLTHVILGIEEKKGKDIVDIDLRKMENRICDHFVICHGDSTTQVNAIADSIEKVVREGTGEKVGHREGFQHAEWILLDYFNIVVHIFQKQTRDYYRLEDLWADARVKRISNDL